MNTYEPTMFRIIFKKMVHGIVTPYYKRYARKLQLNKNDKIIDFGSGLGTLAKYMLPYLDSDESQLCCIDISKKWMAICKKRLQKKRNVVFYSGKIKNLRIRNNFFDKIIVHFVLHDIPLTNRQSIINELAKKIHKNGIIIIREPISKRHGMPIEEIKAIMRKAGLSEESSKFARRPFAGKVFDGIFTKL